MKESGRRTTEIFDFLLPCMEARFAESCRAIQTELDRDADKIWGDFKSVLCFILSMADGMQKKRRKGSIQYLAFSFLKSSIYLGKLELRIDVMDDSFYLDGQESCGYYHPAFLQQKYSEDLDFLFRKAKEQFVRLQHFELIGIKTGYAAYYDAVLYRMVESLAGQIMELIIENGVGVSENFKIIYGEYMGSANVVYTKETDRYEIFSDGNR